MTDQTIYIVDDDDAVRDAMSILLDTIGLAHESFATANAFLEFIEPEHRGCVVLDIRMPGMNGLQCQSELKRLHSALPVIFITGHGDIPMAVEAMREGALDFIRKPFRDQDLLDRIQQALEIEAGDAERNLDRARLREQLISLTDREKEIFERIAEGQANKVVALDLGVSERTVEVHRAQVMKKLSVRTLAQLVRLKILSEERDFW